jgi:hypothetical protein
MIRSHASIARSKGYYFVTREGVTAKVGRTNLESVSRAASQGLSKTKTYRSLLYAFVLAPNSSFSIACCE